MNNKQSSLTHYFWATNILLWLAASALFVHIQWIATLNSDSPQTWVSIWFRASYWFLHWIWVTAAVFAISERIEANFESTHQKIFFHLLSAISLLATYWCVCNFFRLYFLELSLIDFWTSLSHIVFSSAQLDIIIYACVFVGARGIGIYHRRVHEKYEVKRLQNLLIQEQLKALRSQLNPHFLFNTLNTIASLVRLKREKQAVFALSELSTMLRKILENKNHQEIRLQDEISFINSYLAIQKLRFTDKLDTHIQVQSDCLDLHIPNMLLQPLVENAVQHGSQLESNQNPLSVEISRVDGNLNFVMINKVANNDRHEGFGIGLSNTRKRLSKLYDHFKLELTPLNGGLFETVLVIPIGAEDA
ncbi:sensor histidine kinase [Ningiella sp. W23]|uniref:sensor histidine kinase n=1 Tax=Ningiella sp. W23 TaxID=3023715 RepID=UPI0037569C9E